MNSRQCFRAVATVVFVFAALIDMTGQVATGTPQFGSFGGSQFDTINLGNLNIHLAIPIVERPGRGMPFYYVLSYDSSVWTHPQGSWLPALNWGWRGQTEIATGYLEYHQEMDDCTPRPIHEGDPIYTYYTFDEFVYHDAWGVQHHFNASAYDMSECPNPPIPAVTTIDSIASDSSGYHLVWNGNNRITGRSGKAFQVPQNITSGSGTAKDANGNVISVNTSGVFTDTLGTPALTISGNDNPGPLYLTYPKPGGGTLTVTVSFLRNTVETYFHCPNNIGEYGPLENYLVSSIAMPDGSSYSFTYEPSPNNPDHVTGRIAAVTLPTGGTISYSYYGGSNGITCEDGTAATLWRYTPDTVEGAHWTYARTGTGTNWRTDITAPDAQKSFTRINFQKSTTTYNFYETSRYVYNSSNENGPLLPLLLQQFTCYNSTSAPCDGVAITEPLAARAVYTYPEGGSKYKVSSTSFDGYGLPTETDDWDWSTSGTGTLLRKVLINYDRALSNGIVDRPSQVAIQGYNSQDPQVFTTVAQTTYAYDVGTPAVPTWGTTPQHDPVYGSRGNVTSISRWVQGSTWLTTNLTYFDTGLVKSTTDPNGAEATLDYNSVEQGSNRCANSFPTTTHLPLNLNTSQTWDCSGAVPTGSSDANSQPTSLSYDSVGRLHQVLYPDDGQTTYDYSTIANAWSTTVTEKINASQHRTTVTQLDALGRESRRASANGQQTNPWDQVDTCYNSVGQIGFVAYPYQSTGFSVPKVCSGAGDTFAYDVLGRLTTTTHSDGSQARAEYLAASAKIIDEGNNVGPPATNVQRISQSDGLGRIIKVCEVTGATLVGSEQPQADCGLDIAGGGFLTTYQHDGLDNLSHVSQGTQTRTFVYDGLARLTSEATPESGTTAYIYDGNGDLYQRTRPAPNFAASSGKTATTTYSYDNLHRLVTVNYTGNGYTETTPPAYLNYGESSAWGVSLSNSAGRLTSEYVGSNGYIGALAGALLSYDQMGLVTNNSQCTPSTCGQTRFNVAYTYDLLGNTATFLNGFNVTLTAAYNSAARLTEVSSSLDDATHPRLLVSGITYNALGRPVAANIGNVASETRAYTDRGWLQARQVNGAGTGQPTGSTGSVAVTGTEQSRTTVTQQGTAGTGSVTISGSEQSRRECEYNDNGQVIHCNTYYDSGGVSIIVNGASKTVSYATGTTAGWIASALASAIAQDGSFPVTATCSGTTVYLTARTTGTSTNYPLSTQVTWDTADFTQPSFRATPSGSTLTGGTDQVTTTTYDAGTLALTIGSFQKSVSYAYGSTAASLASALTTGINSDPASPVTATLSGATLNFASKGTGSSTNYSISSTPTSTQGFSPPAFGTNPTQTVMSGGGDTAPAVLYAVNLGFAPNGNVLSAIDNNINGNWTYAYDDFNRLASATQQGQQALPYSYDRHGNRWIPDGSGGWSVGFDNGDNRITGGSYDGAGNLLNDGTNSYAYDAENRMISVTSPLGTTTYTYDAQGRRIKSSGPNGIFEFVYDGAGRTTGQYNVTSGTWTRIEVFANGEHLATYAGGQSGATYFAHVDWLGTERVRSDTSGNAYQTFASLPFGDGMTQAANDASPVHFTSQQRDSESGLDHFWFRNYSSTFGRWMTPDPAGLAAVDSSNPQSWNRYVYLNNDPTDETDEYGLCPAGTHAATTDDANRYIQTAESYLNQGLNHSGDHCTLNSNGALTGIDCTGLIMAALSGKKYNSGGFQFNFFYNGLNLRTSNIEQWTDPGTGAVGDIIYFVRPGHAGIVLGKDTFIGSQGRGNNPPGPAVASFGPNAQYWGNPKVKNPSSAPVFRRPCIQNPKSKSNSGSPSSSVGGAAFSSPEQLMWMIRCSEPVGCVLNILWLNVLGGGWALPTPMGRGLRL